MYDAICANSSTRLTLKPIYGLVDMDAERIFSDCDINDTFFFSPPATIVIIRSIIIIVIIITVSTCSFADIFIPLHITPSFQRHESQ